MSEARAFYANPKRDLRFDFASGLHEDTKKGSSTFSVYNYSGQKEFSLPLSTLPSQEEEKTSSLVVEVNQQFEKKEKERFLKSVELALDDINRGLYQKVVLSRRKKLLVKKGDPLNLDLWKRQFCHPDQYGHQLIWTQGRELFISLSPESLFEIDQQTLGVDAIAATAAVGKTPEETQQLFQALLNSPKEIHEHQMVRDDIQERLAQASIHGEWSFIQQPLVLKHLQHIHSRYQAHLKTSNISETIDQLLNVLHPTPAVGARPRGVALTRQRELESFDRRYYAAPVVIQLPEQVISIVALRCCHVQDNEMTIYAGAGIVQGSDPEQEWLETERKCRQFL